MSPNTVPYITQKDNGEGKLPISLINIALWSTNISKRLFPTSSSFYQIQQFITSTSGEKRLTEGNHCEHGT